MANDKEPRYRDSLFRSYFNDKERLLSLVNALLNTDATDPNEIEINTLDGVFFDEFKNDISCIFRGRFLVLIEHQSTINKNMPRRCLFYVTELYKQIVEPYKDKTYKTKMIKLPQPEFFVLYNGYKQTPETEELRLSEAYGGENINLELVVKVHNIAEGNERLINNSKYLKYYCAFVSRVSYNKSQGMSTQEALIEAITYCINNDIMSEYLKEHKKEVNNMYWFEYDAEAAKRAMLEEMQEEREEGRVEGRAEGRTEGHLEMVKNFIKAGASINVIQKATGWSEEKIMQIENASGN